MNHLKRLYDLTLQRNRERDLKNTLLFRQALRCPDLLFKSVHVAGTNGKGSVSLKIAKSLELSGYKVGLYTSPHISSFRERIQVQGRAISKEAFERHLAYLFHRVDELQIQLTFFEITTFLAFLYFAEQKVDYAIIEVGLGGRLDTTNMITPCLSVITSIGWDHMHILGSTLEAIAYEKAGIIKEGVPVVIGANADFAAIREKAKEKNAPLFKAEANSHPFYDSENRETALAALKLLPAAALALQYRPPCRFEEVQDVIMDVAHNPSAFQKLKASLLYFYPKSSFRFLLAFSEDKDIAGCLSEIIPIAKHIHIVKTNHARLAHPNKIEPIAKEMGFHAISSSENLPEEFAKARSFKDRLIVTGSFFIMGEVRKLLGLPVDEDELLLQEQYLFKS